MPQVRDPTEERLLNAVLDAQEAYDIAYQANQEAQYKLYAPPDLLDASKSAADQAFAALEAAEAVLNEAVRLYDDYLNRSAHRRPQELPFSSGPIPVPTPTPRASGRRRNHTVATTWRRYASSVDWAALGAVALSLILLVGAFWAYNNTVPGRVINDAIFPATTPGGSTGTPGGPTNGAIIDLDTCTVKLDDGSTQPIEGCTPVNSDELISCGEGFGDLLCKPTGVDNQCQVFLPDGVTPIVQKDSGFYIIDCPVDGSPVPSAPPAKECADNPDYCTPPQPQIGHPSMYLETGVPDTIDPSNANTKTWRFQLESNMVAIIGGFTVDGQSDGVYKAIRGPKWINTTVTDGFISVIIEEWANNEFCFRLDQAVQYDWAHAHVRPLKSWNSCSTYDAIIPENEDDGSANGGSGNPGDNNNARRPSGVGNTISFNKNESVVGFKIVINGRNYSECYFKKAPGDGSVTDGVVNYKDGEQNAAKNGAC